MGLCVISHTFNFPGLMVEVSQGRSGAHHVVTKEAKFSLGVASSSRLSLMMRCTTLGGMEDLGNLQKICIRHHSPRKPSARLSMEENTISSIFSGWSQWVARYPLLSGKECPCLLVCPDGLHHVTGRKGCIHTGYIRSRGLPDIQCYRDDRGKLCNCCVMQISSAMR